MQTVCIQTKLLIQSKTMNKPPNYKLHSLLHSAHLMEDNLRKTLEKYEIRPQQARILEALNIMNRASQVELTREFRITAGSMSSMVTRLEALGFISRYRKPGERRSDVLELTDFGRSKLTDIHATWAEMDKEIEDSIGVEKAEQLFALTEELKRALGAHIPGDF